MEKYIIDPISKPRMTQRDRWKKRPCVIRYWKYRDQMRSYGATLPEGNCHVTFVIPMPKSWGRKKRDLMLGNPHQQRPDIDNLVKGLLDALFDEDCRVWDLRSTKRWGDQGEIWLETMN